MRRSTTTNQRPTAMRLVGAMVFLLALAACGGNTEATTDPGSDEPSAATTVTTPATSVVTDTSGATTEPEAAPDEGAAVELSMADVFEPIATQPTEASPRPLLAWEPVEGAAVYQVVVLGSDGQPYWAWSGTETMINVGGNEEPDAIGAWVHESMTWTVSAQGSDGEVLGLSTPASLEP